MADTFLTTFQQSLQRLSQLEKPHEPRVLVQSDVTKTSISYEDIQSKAQRLQNQLTALRGQRVAIALPPTVNSIIALLALDGLVQSLILLAPDVSPDNTASQLPADVHTLIDEHGHLHALCADAVDPGWSGQSQWGLFSSGTTGQPVLSYHTIHTLNRSVNGVSERSGNFRWGLLYESHRFAGIQVMLQALLGGSDLVLCADAPTATRVRWMQQAGVNALSATPSMWRLLLMSDAGQRLSLRQVTLGGEIADPGILAQLSKAYPLARIVHVYASTEAGVGFSVADGQAGFPTEWLETQYQTDVQLKIVDDELWLRPPGYESFVNSGDAVVIDAERVYFAGRSSGAINVGGNKVHPELIEQHLSLVPQVQGIIAYGFRNTMLGELVAVDLLVDDGAREDVVKQALQQRAKQVLQPWQRPARIRFVRSLSVNQNGKLVRQTLPFRSENHE